MESDSKRQHSLPYDPINQLRYHFAPTLIFQNTDSSSSDVIWCNHCSVMIGWGLQSMT